MGFNETLLENYLNEQIKFFGSCLQRASLIENLPSNTTSNAVNAVNFSMTCCSNNYLVKICVNLLFKGKTILFSLLSTFRIPKSSTLVSFICRMTLRSLTTQKCVKSEWRCEACNLILRMNCWNISRSFDPS
jgi:hypothetical protein